MASVLADATVMTLSSVARDFECERPADPRAAEVAMRTRAMQQVLRPRRLRRPEVVFDPTGGVAASPPACGPDLAGRSGWSPGIFGFDDPETRAGRSGRERYMRQLVDRIRPYLVAYWRRQAMQAESEAVEWLARATELSERAARWERRH